MFQHAATRRWLKPLLKPLAGKGSEARFRQPVQKAAQADYITAA
ncbi:MULTISPECIES: hypothetical protein [unclassified Neisseria]|nr:MULTISPECIES: hypothetical protein [unclassified Neisseria]MDO1510971.1 hypothetical protein [Neisseria sp. MVDL19-042950]MDO1517230.1 hypothetical protein [Neisseria sp. MVDL18-041461]MDO1564593.1 hypothetical protein [Neisseria sp. MVDL20-010259]